MVNFTTNKTEFESELRDIIKMFIPFFNMDTDIGVNIGTDIAVDVGSKREFYPAGGATGRELLKQSKIALYKSMSAYFGRELPWGSLTGIRPTKIAYKFLAAGGEFCNLEKYLTETYLVSPQKSELLSLIITAQEKYVFHEPQFINLYVHIPFCPSRCGYCSFVSLDIHKNEAIAEQYLDLLIKEIRATLDLARTMGKRVLTVYVGGGTPTVLTAEQSERLLSCIDAQGIEFTVEAGRPETVTEEKLRVMKENGVTRVSVNPQTFCQATLEKIGRSHTVGDVHRAFDLARKYKFDINMDLIAGLPDEDLSAFEKSALSALLLKPENITVHTLSLKKGTEFLLGGTDFNADTPAMVELAQDVLHSSYIPYYLYRQKNMSFNLENTGFCLSGRECVNNITVMEETVPVWACGAGAISKVIFPEGRHIINARIERLANLRDVRLYTEQFEDRLNKKLAFLAQ